MLWVISAELRRMKRCLLLLSVLTLTCAVQAKPPQPMASASMQGYGSTVGRAVLYGAKEGGCILDLYSVGLPNDRENRGNFRYTLAKPLALEFKKAYFDAKKRVLAMRPEELCQETVDIGGFTSSKPAVEYFMTFRELTNPPFTVKISKGWMDDSRRRIKFISRDVGRYANFTVILTGKGATAAQFDKLLDKIR